RLVELNAERAEEEKQGIVRWLRPEYQALGQPKPRKQSSFVIDVSQNPSKSQVKRAADSRMPSDVSEWPTDELEQIRAVRHAIVSIRSSKGAVTPDRVAECFARGSKKRITDVLHILKELGMCGL
ncbi:MAG: hypothetical protein FWD57_13540, partial [Polyangiaceae bacterium]|nr:hypothetical protein [Polyangiaceae bacterium]